MYFERLVILNQTRINCSFSSIDRIKCLFNCVIYLFIDKRSRVIDMKFYFHLVNYVSVGYLRKTKISKKSCLTIFLLGTSQHYLLPRIVYLFPSIFLTLTMKCTFSFFKFSFFQCTLHVYIYFFILYYSCIL
jgi:hypothetical protein